jgi:hypothetical protein
VRGAAEVEHFQMVAVAAGERGKKVVEVGEALRCSVLPVRVEMRWVAMAAAEEGQMGPLAVKVEEQHGLPVSARLLGVEVEEQVHGLVVEEDLRVLCFQ